MFIDEMKGDDARIYEFLAEKFKISLEIVKKSVIFMEDNQYFKSFRNVSSNPSLKLPVGNMAFSDFNFYHVGNKWEDNKIDQDWMLFMYKIFGQRYINEFCLIRVIYQKNLFKSLPPKERKKRIKQHNQGTEDICNFIKIRAAGLEHFY